MDDELIQSQPPGLSTRALTTGEVDLVRSVFGMDIDVSRVSIRRKRWFPFQPKSVVMAPLGHIHFHPKGSQYCDDFSHAGLVLQGLFIHEMVHVWQHQQGIFLPLRRLPFSRYSYSLKPGWKLKQYGIEQQAEIVRHWFMLSRGREVPGAPPIEQYAGILPFRPVTTPTAPASASD